MRSFLGSLTSNRFKADISIFAVPLMAVGFLLSISKIEKRRNISEFIIGFSLLFLLGVVLRSGFLVLLVFTSLKPICL